MAAQNAELSRRIFEDVWNRKNLALSTILSPPTTFTTTPIPLLPTELMATSNLLITI